MSPPHADVRSELKKLVEGLSVAGVADVVSETRDSYYSAQIEPRAGAAPIRLEIDPHDRVVSLDFGRDSAIELTVVNTAEGVYSLVREIRD